MPTKKHPSPSTKPTTRSGLRLSCWLSAPIGLSLHHRVPSDPPEFPAYSRMHTPPLLTTGASDLTLGPFVMLRPLVRGGAVISAALCMSPCSPDHIIPR